MKKLLSLKADFFKCVFSLFLIHLVSLFLTNCATKSSLKSVQKQTLAVAHRGAWKAKGLPGNSIAAFREAIRLKCAGSEFDVNMTADDSLVITHGPNYHSMPIEKTLYADLIKVNLPNGEKLPTLREFIIAGIRNNTTTRFFCEIKSSSQGQERGLYIADKVYKTFTNLKAQRMVTFISFDYEILKSLVKRDSLVDTQYLNNNKTLEDLERNGIKGANFRYPVWQKHPEYIKLAKQKGLILNSGTVNDTLTMDWLIDKKFDYISSDEPHTVIKRSKIKKFKLFNP
ncbi:glycerophosphodiester phosphodiesterase family protein [Leeuwenhoekiella aequorea]|uniref:glycerophosphodiester phosphodiesterase family protein n=1 Tax=Leeuwenhoekiella TaxID=283735 RepID=UPI00352CD6B9|tara:strand:+ start:9226 stop:10080 length:855 start_codon:yes stop_codon:yes gene_type:complete